MHHSWRIFCFFFKFICIAKILKSAKYILFFTHVRISQHPHSFIKMWLTTWYYFHSAWTPSSTFSGVQFFGVLRWFLLKMSLFLFHSALQRCCSTPPAIVSGHLNKRSLVCNTFLSLVAFKSFSISLVYISFNRMHRDVVFFVFLYVGTMNLRSL